MAKDSNFEQFKGQGVKYAPKPPPPAPKPVEQTDIAPAPMGPSEEDHMRDVLMEERHLRRMGNQHRMDQ